MNLSEITASILAMFTTAGYFFVMYGVIQGFPPEGAARDLMNQLIGSLTTVWVMVMSYYYGAAKKYGKTGSRRVDPSNPRGNDPSSPNADPQVDR